MLFTSTEGRAPAADLRTALLDGLAPDGGLYMPAAIAPMSENAVDALRGATLNETARVVLGHLLGDAIPFGHLAGIADEAFNFPIPLVQLEDRLFVLELFHGPTLAFKDVGARCMAGLVSHFRSAATEQLTVLVATSGDTGGAVAAAFHRAPGIRVMVLFPAAGVNERQSRQFTTLGENVRAVAIDGSFDDCQRLVKDMFADEGLRRRVPLTSANSINVGRLLPQAVYYFHALAQMPRVDLPVDCAMPSGNFGNLTAGLLAKRLGLPVRRYVAGTNANRAVPDYLASGVYEPRAAIRTISNAMDVGNPSNLARILAMYDGDVDRIRAVLASSSHSDDETRACIADVSRRLGYILDPHTAVGMLGLRCSREGPDSIGVVLATAHPAKFSETVEPLIDRPVKVPERLAAVLDGTAEVTSLPPEAEALRALIESG